MGRPLRNQKPDSIYFVTSGCLERMFFFRPSKEVNRIILGILARVADRFDIEIFAFVFMSNHLHMIVRSRSCQIHLFMEEFLGQVARALNKHWGRSGSFFHRRYDASEILDDEALLDKLRYTVCNPCESNLVRHPKVWPGLSSWSIHETGEPLVGEWVNSKEYWRLKRKYKEMSDAEAARRATIEYPLHMAKLPMWEALDDEAYRKKVCKEVCEWAEHLADKRTVRCVGVKKILAQSFDDRPHNPRKKTPRPVCHASCPDLKDEYLEELRLVTDRYRQAVGKLRRGISDFEFPNGTIPPGHRYCVGAPQPRDRLATAA